MEIDNVSIVCMLAMIVMFFCVPMLKRMDELDMEIDKLHRKLDEIKKALYVIPEDGDASND